MNGKWIIDKGSWIGGLSPSVRLGRQSQYADAVAMDLYRNVGAVTPGYLPVSVGSTTVTDLIKWLEPGQSTAANDEQYLYGYGDSGKIYRIAQSNGAPSVVHTIGSYSGSANGLETYAISGTNFLLYSHNTDIGASPSDWSAVDTGWDDDYWTTVVTGTHDALTTGLPHPMKKFLTMLLIGDGNKLLTLTGSVGAVAFTLPKGEVIVSIEEWSPYAAILTRTVSNGAYVGNAKIYLWDGTSTSYNKVIHTQENYATAIKNVGGILYITMGGGKKYLGYYDGSGIKKVSTIPATTLPIAGGIDGGNGAVYFLAMTSGGKGDIFTYDTPYPELPAALNKPLRVLDAQNGTATLGALRVIDYNNIIAAFYTGAAYKLYQWTAKYDTTTSFSTMSFDFGTVEAKQWDHFKFWFSTLAAGEAIQFAYSTNGGASYTNFTSGNPTYAANGAISFWKIDEPIEGREISIKITMTAGTSNNTAPVFVRGEADWATLDE